MNENEAMGEARSLVNTFRGYDGPSAPGYDGDLVREITKHPRVFDYLFLELHFEAVASMLETEYYRSVDLDRSADRGALRFGVPNVLLGREVASDHLETRLGEVAQRWVGASGWDHIRLYEVDAEYRREVIECLRRMWREDELDVAFPRKRSQL